MPGWPVTFLFLVLFTGAAVVCSSGVAGLLAVLAARLLDPDLVTTACCLSGVVVVAAGLLAVQYKTPHRFHCLSRRKSQLCGL